MFGLRLTLQASAALTMRVLPSGILDIITYPFVPPTTLSGWLRRVWMLAEGHDLPETSVTKDAPYYVLPRDIISLGAYPVVPSLIHKTKRKGVKDFKSTNFTRLMFDKDTAPTFQLHTWEYLTTDKLHAYVVSEDAEALKHLQSSMQEEGHSVPWGCKLGKEGFAYLLSVSEVQPLVCEEATLTPITLLPLDTVIRLAEPVDMAVHNIHLFAWREGEHTLAEPSPVKGYDIKPLVLAQHAPSLKTMWWRGSDMHFPTGLEDVLQGVSA